MWHTQLQKSDNETCMMAMPSLQAHAYAWIVTPEGIGIGQGQLWVQMLYWVLTVYMHRILEAICGLGSWATGALSIHTDEGADLDYKHSEGRRVGCLPHASLGAEPMTGTSLLLGSACTVMIGPLDWKTGKSSSSFLFILNETHLNLSLSLHSC